MKREDILKSPAYWTANIQIELAESCQGGN